MPVAIEGCGTDESRWREWTGWSAMREIAPCALLGRLDRAVIVSPHPDDEVLALGASIAAWTGAGRSVLVVSVTDGEASHPRSSFWTPQRLRDIRIRELEQAIGILGNGPRILRLGMADGGLEQAELGLSARLERIFAPGDIVFSTWRGDGHPDHEAAGRAASRAALRTGARHIEVPVWTWHWAEPGDSRVPWHRAARLPGLAQARRRKQAALRAFRSQTGAAPGDAGEPVLSPNVLERFDRPFETIFL